MCGKTWRWMLVGCALVIGCESSTQVGSTCKNGVCPQASAVVGPVCAISEEVAEIIVTNVPNIPAGLAAVCLAGPLPVDADGTVGCELRWTVQDPEPGTKSELPEHCADAPYLERIDGEPDTVCRVHQLTVGELAAGKDGWYYDITGHRECRNDDPSVRFTEGATPGVGRVLLNLACMFAQNKNDDEDGGVGWSPIDQCGPLPAPSASHVGEACTPRVVPEQGFDDRVASLHLGAGECPGGGCLVYHLRGDPSSDCSDPKMSTPDAGSQPSVCADPNEQRERVYCTCRCDAPEGEPECACPHGFSCQPALADVSGDLRGGYCVKDGT